MGNGLPTHGREGVLYLSTSTGTTAYGTEVGYSDDWTWTPSKDQVEINRLNHKSKEFLEGLVSGFLRGLYQVQQVQAVLSYLEMHR